MPIFLTYGIDIEHCRKREARHKTFINKLVGKGCHPVTAENKWMKKRFH